MAEQKVTESSRFLGALVQLSLAGSSRLSFPAAQAFGTLIGHLTWRLAPSPRRVALLNLAWCLPHLAAAERRRIARASLIATGRNFAELGPIFRWPVERLRDLEAGVEGEELLAAALAGGRGAVLLLPHLGNWEMLNPFLAQRRPFVALYRPPRIAQIEAMIRRSRERTGCTMLPATRRGVRELFRSLEAGRLLVVLPDQEPVRSSGVFAPFFGVPALTMTLVARLLRRFGSPALFAYALREGDGRFGFRFRAAPEGLADNDRVSAAGRLNLGVERCVLDCPEQYMWAYKRFKSRPPEEHEASRSGREGPPLRLYRPAR